MLSRAAVCRAGLRFPRSSRAFTSTAVQNADFTHAVIGGGVVGLAVARQLQAREGASVVLIEKHKSVGMETSSRNSEVIHAGLYYGPDSLKTSLCLRGKSLLYTLCEKHSIPYKNCGKWIVAQSSSQRAALENVHSFASSINVPTRFLSTQEAQSREPDVRAAAGVLESPSTGIVDSHALMQFLEGDFLNKGGLASFQSPVTRIEALERGKRGWRITTQSTTPKTTTSYESSNTTTKEPEKSEEETTITAETLINSAGLYAIPLSNSILPPERHIKPHYAKGTYFSYALSHPRPKTLIYPAPIPGHAGLGTHLTLDLAGRIRFGPDVEWTDSPTDYTPNSRNLTAALDDIQSYLPGIDRSAVGLDYVGIRPKLGRKSAVATGGKGTGDGFQDFWIKREEGFEGFVNLLGIESPGLTSSLAIGEFVEGLLYK